MPKNSISNQTLIKLMQKRVPSQLIEKYLAGKCSVEEEAKLYEWYNSFKEIEDPFLQVSKGEKKRLKVKMFAKIAENVNLNLRPAGLRRFPYLVAAGIAAVLLLVFIFIKPASKEPIVKNDVETVPGSEIYFMNTSSRIHKYELPDNSIIWLKPNASISYSKNFIAKIRRVEFTGEAFFEVEKDKEHPFHIYSGDLVTEVLGTSFNVKANAIDNTAEVSVVTGKVLVRTEDTPESPNFRGVYLQPREKVTYLKDVHQLVKLSNKDQSLDIWKKNTLSFDNEPVLNVIQALNRTFKAKIIVADVGINDYTLKADFTDVNLPTIMELLSKSLNITYKIQGDDIVISQGPQTNLNN